MKDTSRPHVGVIFAGGKGARLDRPDTPKPLVKVGNKPLIQWNIEQLQNAGVMHIYIVIGDLGEEIKKELTNLPAITAKLEYFYESDSSKSGVLKSLVRLAEIIGESFYATMADLIIEKNPYFILERSFLDQEKVAIALVDLREVSMRSGALSQVKIKDNFVVSVGRNLSDFDGLEVGVYYFGTNILSRMRDFSLNDKTGTLDLFLMFLAQKRDMYASFIEDGEWFDINTPSTHIKAEMFVRSGLSSEFLPPLKHNLKTLEPVTSFHRVKNLSTDIVIENRILDKLSELKIIPDGCVSAVHFLLTDETVDKLHAEKILLRFRAAGYDVRKIVVPDGEKSKSIAEFTRVSDEIFSLGMDKRSILISLGGGVVNNIAGFLASTLYRGIGLIHIPTTTMAQVDAAIDFKQGINSTKGKNLYGSYYPASLIIIDPSVLLTLDSRNMVNGISESIKHALTQDKDFLEYLLKSSMSLSDIDTLESIVRKTIELKVPLLNGATKDDFNEMLPQYGHSIGHAIERLSSYDLLHGEAIAVGMCVSAEISFLLGICKKDVVDAHYSIFRKYNLPVSVPSYISTDDILSAMKFDKHYVEKPYMALVKDVGVMFHDRHVFGIPVDYEVVRRALNINKKTYEE